MNKDAIRNRNKQERKEIEVVAVVLVTFCRRRLIGRDGAAVVVVAVVAVVDVVAVRRTQWILQAARSVRRCADANLDLGGAQEMPPASVQHAAGRPGSVRRMP